MNEHNHPSSREAALRGLAIVGFLALVGLGIWLAVYSGRYVPAAVNGLGGAAVGLTSLFHPATSTLSVVPSGMGTSTIYFGDASSTATSTATTSVPATGTGSGAPKAPGSATSGVYPLGPGATSTGPAPFYGLPDLAISITATGYLATSSTDSFVAASTTPAGSRPAIKFTIRNVGTNVMASGWVFSARIPTASSYFFTSAPQQALNPGDSIDYTLGFDQPNPGVQSITVTANANRTIAESTTANNEESVQLTILGR